MADDWEVAGPLEPYSHAEKLKDVINTASQSLPSGYSIRFNSINRPGSKVAGTGGVSQHSLNKALDISIIGPDGKPIPNTGEDTTGLYGTLAASAHRINRTKYPDLDGKLAWGGNFTTGPANGPKDLMHFDYGGDRGRFGKLAALASPSVAHAGTISSNDEWEVAGPLEPIEAAGTDQWEVVGQPEPIPAPEPVDYSGLQGSTDVSQVTAKGFGETVSPIVQGAAPIAGAVGGAVLAAPGGPPAMVAGGALGYGAGKQLSNVIAEARGTRERPPTGQALVEAGKDLAVGGMLSLPGGTGAGAVAQAVGAGLGYGASQEAERAYSEGTGESVPLPTGEALIGAAKNVGMGTAMAAPFSFLPWAANAHAEKQAKTAQKELDSTIDKISRKAFMSGVAGQKTAAQIDKYTDKMNFVIKDITQNKASLNIVNAEGSEVAGQLPQTRREMIQAVSQGKQRIFDQFDAMAKQAGQEGILIDPEPIAKEILKLSQTKAVNIANPTAIAYAEKMAEQLVNSGPLTPKEAQSVIAAFNDKLSAFYGNPSFADVSNIAVDAVAVGQLRKSLDDAITSVRGPGYQELKNAYGAYSTIEKDVARAAVTGARAAPKGLVDFFDIVTAHQGAMALIHLSPEALVSAGTMGAIKHYWKNLNNRDKMVSKMFSKVDEALTKQAANEIKAPFVPGGELPASLQADIATLDKELAGMADNERRQVLAEVYKMYNMDQKLLPAGQTFEMLNAPQSPPYSLELAGSLKGALALPPGQGFKVLEESQRKSQQELRSDLFGIGAPKAPPVSAPLKPEVPNVQSPEMPTEARRIIELAKEAIAKRQGTVASPEKLAEAKASFEARRAEGKAKDTKQQTETEVKAEFRNKVITPDGKTQKQVDSELVSGLKAEMEARKAKKTLDKPEIKEDNGLTLTQKGEKPMKEENEVGRKWNSDQGEQKIEGLDKNSEGKPVYAVSTKDSNIIEFIPVDQMERTIKSRESWYAAGEKHKVEAKLEAEKAAIEKAKKYDTNGFTDNMADIKKEKSIFVLEKQIRIKGKQAKLREHMERLTDEGWTVEVKDGEKRLVSPDGGFYLPKDITKTAIDYAEHLTTRKTETKPDSPEPMKVEKEQSVKNNKFVWEIPRKEYAKLISEGYGFEAKESEVRRAAAENNHKKVIERAISEGKPVPPKVLKDYPELKQPSGAQIESQAADIKKLEERKQMLEDIIATNKANGRTPNQAHLDKLAEIKAQLKGEIKPEGISSNPVFGHPEATTFHEYQNLIPFAAKDVETVERFMSRAQRKLDELQHKVARVEAMSTGKITGTKKQVADAKAYMNSHNFADEKGIRDLLREETLPELQRMHKELSKQSKPDSPKKPMTEQAEISELAKIKEPSGAQMKDIENLEPEKIIPLHQVKDASKMKKLIESMKKEGWNGEPILAVDTGNGIFALTGSHRIEAAKNAEIEAKVKLLDFDAVEKWASKTGNSINDLLSGSDDAKLEVLKEIGDKDAVAIMKYEIDKKY